MNGQRLANHFALHVLAPLARGGAVHVGAPLGRLGLETLRSTRPDPSVEAELFAARADVVGELLYDPIPPQLDLEALRLGVSVHDLLFLFHPRARGPGVSEGKLAEVARYAAALAVLPASTDPDVLAARHSVLHLLPALGRTDVRVTFWAGSQEFHGQDPPRRMTSWPTVRRVREEHWRVGCFAEAASHPLGRAVVAALFDGSPLTDLLNPARLEPRLDLARRADVLRIPQLARAVAWSWLEAGVERLGSAIAAAVLGALDGRAPAGAGRLVLCFVAHLHLCALLEPREKPPAVRAPLGEGRPSFPRLAVAASGGDPALRDYFGLYAALHRSAPELAAPDDVRADAGFRARVDEYAAACATACGSERVLELCSLIGRLGGPVAVAAQAGAAG